MRRWSPLVMALTLGGSVLLWAALAGVCLLVGSTGIHWPEAGQVGLRLESLLMASLVGAALAAAGTVYQAILRNPLADPYLLGISSGASLAAFLWRLPFAASALGAAALLSQQGFAFAGALASVAIVFGVAQRRGRLDPVGLLLTGVIVNAVNGSVFLLINALKKDMTPGSGAFAFLVGGIQTNLKLQQEIVAAGCIACGWLVLFWLAGQLNVAPLSEGEAQALGVRIHALRWIGLIVASLVTASAVAISGPIGFVGLICPHVGRLIVGTDQRRLFPIATALGAGLLALADAGSRLLVRQGLAETLLPVGVLTGMVGGPFFLLLLWQSQRKRGT